jgi:hypothetical protein
MAMSGADRGDPSRTTSSPPGRTSADPVAAAVVVNNEREQLRDRIRWGPVWAGLVVAVATYLLLQVLLIAVGLVEVADAETSDAVWSAVAALVAFILGGITAGATAMWRGVDDGLLHGVVLWALGITALLFIGGVGGGIAVGSIDASDVFDDATSVEDTGQANDDAQEAAGRALTGIVAALVAAGIGGAVGAKLWPSRDDADMYGDRSRAHR